MRNSVAIIKSRLSSGSSGRPMHFFKIGTKCVINYMAIQDTVDGMPDSVVYELETIDSPKRQQLVSAEDFTLSFKL